MAEKDVATESIMREEGERLVLNIENRTLSCFDENRREFRTVLAQLPQGELWRVSGKPDPHRTWEMFADFGVTQASKRGFRLGFRPRRSEQIAGYLRTAPTPCRRGRFSACLPRGSMRCGASVRGFDDEDSASDVAALYSDGRSAPDEPARRTPRRFLFLNAINPVAVRAGRSRRWSNARGVVKLSALVRIRVVRPHRMCPFIAARVRPDVPTGQTLETV